MMTHHAVTAIAAVALWSTNALAAKYAMVELTVVQLLTLQFGSATVCFALLRAKQAGGRALLVEWPSGSAMLVGVVGLTGTIFLQYLAFALGDILEANVIAYAWPLFVAVWAALAVGNLQTRLGLLLAILGFAGVVLIFDARGGLSFDSGAGLGYVLAVASAACMAFYTVAASRIRVSGVRLLLPATALGTAVALAISLVQEPDWPHPTVWWMAVYIGIGPMAAGFALWTWAISGDGAKRLAPIGYAIPLLSTILLLLSGEAFTTQTLLGAALVLVCSIGVLVVDRVLGARQWSKAEKPDPWTRRRECVPFSGDQRGC